MMKTIESEKCVSKQNNFAIKSQDWLDNSPVCTKVVDPDFNLLYMSRAGVEALKIDSIGDFYGKSFPLDFYPEEFKTTMCEKLQIVKDTGETMVHEGKIITKDQKELWFESTISPVYDDNNQLDYFMVVSLEISKRKQAEVKELLLKEIHHRIKNNLQIVSSLLSLQSAEIKDIDFKRIIENSKQRIRTISLVHEKMYESNVSGEIHVKSYIEELVSNISSTFLRENNAFRSDIQIDDFKLNMDIMVPCSLILNEIITNIFKYGFKSNLDPCLQIHIKKKGNEISMKVGDNGLGMNKKTEDCKEMSLGMKLIKALTVQLQADIKIESVEGKGVCYTIRFEL